MNYTNTQLLKVLQILQGGDVQAPTFREYGLKALKLTSAYPTKQKPFTATTAPKEPMHHKHP